MRFLKHDNNKLITEDLLGHHDVYRSEIDLLNDKITWKVLDSTGQIINQGSSNNILNAKTKVKIELVKLGVKFKPIRRNVLRNYLS